MARKKSYTEEIINLTTKTEAEPEVESKVEAEAQPEVEAKEDPTAPVNIELETPSDEPVAAPEAPAKEKIETDVRAKLSKKSVDENVFVPSNPAALEKEAKAVASEQGFELNRGTSIGARLMARRRLG